MGLEHRRHVNPCDKDLKHRVQYPLYLTSFTKSCRLEEVAGVGVIELISGTIDSKDDDDGNDGDGNDDDDDDTEGGDETDGRDDTEGRCGAGVEEEEVGFSSTGCCF